MLTTTQAAHQAKTSRPTISRALKSGELLGKRGNDLRWLIDPKDLEEWIKHRSRVHAEHGANDEQTQQKSPEFERLNDIFRELVKAKEDLAEVRQTLARAEAENTAHRERIIEISADRDHWRQMAERLSQAQPIIRSRGFLDWLLGRSGRGD